MESEIMVERKAKIKANAALFRAHNKEKISDKNSECYARMKSNPEFMERRNASILRSVHKRKLANLKENPKPVRSYIKKQIATLESLAKVVPLQN